MNIQQLRERYAAPEIPKCRVCGGVLTVQRAGGGPTIWGCTGMIDDPTGERNWIYAEGRSCADEHYERSRWSDYRQGGDADVIEIIDALEAAEKLAEFRLKSINSMDALVAGRNNRISELESWARAVEESMISASDRAEAAERERDELRLEIARIGGAKAIDVLRRDAAAGEPYGYVHKSLYETGGSAGLSNDHEAYRDSLTHIALYTAAQPAVLPELEQDVKNIIGLLSENEWTEHCTKSELGRKLEGEITRLHDLRAQQQKVVELPEPVKWPEIPFKYFSEEQVFSMLDAAGVKWEVKK